MAATFAAKLLQWYDQAGRKDLPWQHPRTAYRVWLAEIMLQQTQVTTVIPYYQRFIQRFPDIANLAAAELDQVLKYWSGLGYYARARNLHQAAKQICAEHAGSFPNEFTAVLALPGIGRSTAGAILAQAFEQRHAILDGNVKRVLTRFFAVPGWPGDKAVAAKLWDYAEQLTPDKRLADYTQAIMDLGATVCRRNQPLCQTCPISNDCQAYQQNNVIAYPARRPKTAKPTKAIQMLLLQDSKGRYLLQRRPPTGIWGGLLGLPEIPVQQDISVWAEQRIGKIQLLEHWPDWQHTFSHFHLVIHPVLAKLIQARQKIADNSDWLWCLPNEAPGGLAAPVEKLLQQAATATGLI